MSADTDVQVLAQRSAELLMPRTHAGLVTDFDGTLSPIVQHPEKAQPLPLAVAALRRLVRHLGVVAVVSGRRADDVAARLRVPGVVIVGNHGAEWLEDGAVRLAPSVAAWIPRVQEAADVLRRKLPELLVEDKLVTLTVHLRGVGSPDVRERARLTVEEVASAFGLAVRPGREVLEVRLPLALDKGTAVEELVLRYDLRALVFAGDDVTDLDAMQRLRHLRRQGVVRALLVGVSSSEAPPALAVEADVLVDGVEAFAHFLVALAERLDLR